MDHRAILEMLCRICGRTIVMKSYSTNKHSCMDYQGELHRAFGITPLSDDPTIHPVHFCHACKLVLTKSTKLYQHRTTIFEGWCIHSEVDCTICEYYSRIQRGGRPKKLKRTPGRPSYNSPKYCIEHIRGVAPTSLSPPEDTIVFCDIHSNSKPLECPICCSILRRPVELITCGSVICAECLCGWLQCQNSFNCPCCYSDHLQDFSTIRKPPPLVISLLESLCLICNRCNCHVQWKSSRDHTCNHSSVTALSPNTRIEEILLQSSTTPLTGLEEKLQTSLARRSLSTEEDVLQLKTGGKVFFNT